MNRFARFVLLAIVVAFTFDQAVLAQEEQTKGEFSLGAVRTQAEKSAVKFATKYLEPMSGKDVDMISDDWAATISPNIDIQAGGDDTFERVVAKLEGLALVPGSYELKDDGAEVHYYVPIALGVEADRNFENYAALAELGYAKFLKQDTWGAILDPLPTVVLQAGYKFSNNETNLSSEAAGGNASESEEGDDDWLARVKASFALNYRIFAISEKDKGFKTAWVNGLLQVNIVGNADFYYDMVNSEWYDREQVSLKLKLRKDLFGSVPVLGKIMDGLSDQVSSLDLSYENGSGAPDFNKGEQFSANLTVAF